MVQLSFKIFDEEYAMRSKAGEDTAHLKRLAEYVHEMMLSVSSQSPALSSKQVAVMTSLNLADRLLRLETGLPVTVEGELRARALADRIETTLADRSQGA
jgi:cell division protein ZapA (FtsZ GTPase activity inhibitor)